MRFLLYLTVIIPAILLAFPKFVSLEKTQGFIIDHIEAATLLKLDVKSTKMKLLPLPVLKLKRASLSKNNDILLVADQIILGISIADLLSGDIKVNNITFSGADVNTDKAITILPSLLQTSSSYFNLNNFSFETSRFSNIHKIMPLFAKNSLIDASFNISPSSRFEIKGVSNYKENSTNFSMQIDNIKSNESNIILTLDSNINKFNMQGRIFNFIKDASLIGKFNNDIKDLKSFLSIYTESKFIKQLNDNEAISLSGDININKNNVIYNNVLFKSDIIAGKFATKNAINEVNDYNMNLHITNLDLNKFLNSKNNEQIKEFEITEENQSISKKIDFKNLLFPEDTNISLNAIIDEIKYGELVIKDGIVDVDLYKDNIMIYKFAANIDKAADFNIYGKISYNEFRPVFEGKIVSSGNHFSKIANNLFKTSYVIDNNFDKFNLSSNVFLSERELSLLNLSLYIEDIFINGSSIYKYSFETPKIQNNLRIHNFDMDKYKITEKSIAYVKNIVTGSDQEDYITKFQPIRQINSISNFDLTFVDLVTNGQNFDKVKLSLGLAPGVFNINHLSMSNNDNKNISLGLDVTDLRPKITANINLDSFDKDKFYKFIDYKPQDADKDKLNLFRFDKFDGKLCLKIDSFLYDNIYLTDLKTIFEMQDGHNNITDFEAKYGEGKITAKAIISPSPQNITISFGAMNLGADSFIQKFLSLNNIKGKVSVSGSVALYGNEISKFLPLLDANLAVAMRDITLDGLNIDKYIEYVRGANNFDGSSYNTEVASLLNNGTTKMLNFDANLSIKQGLVEVKKSTFGSNLYQGALAGFVNLSDLAINAVSKINFIPKINEKTIALNFKITEKLPKPQVNFDGKEAELYLKKVR